ncbi:S9 family peptidase [uncultured Sphingomonas sp.]|uniref:S9 family peptidase n=1 Tax=uncultured Sphingomonas sp. TaxID=158754 RepID=UPI0025EF2383|nr:S9 family peptidase [uncultured Sphingomonas sp.]
MKQIVACIALALAATAATAQPAPKQVLTHETLWMMKRVGAPFASPDGKWVAYALTEPSYEADKAVSDLWLVSADGSTAPRRLTSTRGGENDPVWSPDSRRIAFAAKREGDDQAQIYILDVAGGGEARRVTNVSTGAARPQWRPDGQAILFETAVYPGALDDAANRKAEAARKARTFNLRVYQHFPIRYWNQWLDEKRPAIMVQPLTEGATARDILSPTMLAHSPGFGGGNVGEGGMSLSPIWSPDGREVVFVATVDRWNAAFANVGFNLYRMPADGGEPRLVTPTSGEFNDPVFTADGKSLLFAYTPQSDAVYDLARLTRVAWPQGGAARAVTPGFDGLLTGFAPTPDSRAAYLLVPEEGRGNLYRVALSGGRPVRVAAQPVGGYTSLSIPAKTKALELVAEYGSAVNPAEVVRIDPTNGHHRNLTQVNVATAAAIDWAPLQHFWFKSTAGRNIHNMIVTPPNFDPAKKYPLFVFIHGGAASYNSDQIGLRWNYHLLAAAGYVLLMTDYTGSTTFGEAFAREIKHDPLKTPADEIEQAVDEALKRYSFIDGSRMCAGGASYGGHLTNWLEGTTTRYRCMVSHAGEVDLTTQWGESDFNYGREVTNGGPPWDRSNPIWRDQSPIAHADKWKTPILFSIGERDYRVPLGNTLEAWSIAQRQKVPSRLLVWPDAWHWITKPEDSRQFYKEVGAWLAHYLKDAPQAGEAAVGTDG